MRKREAPCLQPEKKLRRELRLSHHLVLDSKLIEITPKIPLDISKTQHGLLINHWRHIAHVWSFVQTYFKSLLKKTPKHFCCAANKKLVYE